MDSWQDKYNSELLTASKAIADAIKAFGEGKWTIANMNTLKAKRCLKSGEDIVRLLSKINR